MSFNRLLSSLLRGKWLIDPQYAQDHLPVIARIIKGDPLAYDDGSDNGKEDGRTKEEKEKERKNLYRFALVPGAKAGDPMQPCDPEEAPEGSIGVIRITGPVTKYDNCGDPGSLSLADAVKELDQNPNISSIIFEVDSPGGEVDGTQTFANAIKNCSKPTVGFINDGMAASAAYWLISCCDEVIASSNIDGVGSIGVYCTIYDWSEYMKKLGIKELSIYSSLSTEKNIDYREALKGNFVPMQKLSLDPIAQTFIATVEANRTGKLKDVKGADWSKGGLFMASEALQMGLIDSIDSYDNAIQRCVELSQVNQNQNPNKNMFGNKLAKLAALKGKAAADINAATLAEVNAELKEAGIENLAIVASSFEADSTAAVKKANDDLAAAQTIVAEVETLRTANTDLTEKVTKLEGTVAAYGKKPGADSVVPVKTKGDELEAADESWKTSADRERENKKSVNEAYNNLPK